MSATTRGFCAKQGQFDGLCGLYSIVNAVTLMTEQKVDQEALMRAMIEYLERKKELGATFLNGANRFRLVRLMGVARTHCLLEFGPRLAWAKPLLNDRDRITGKGLTVDDFWSRMIEHHRENGDGSIILGLNGRHVHWTCVHSISDRSIKTADSGNENHFSIARIDRRYCTTGKPTWDRPHVLEEAFLLRFE